MSPTSNHVVQRNVRLFRALREAGITCYRLHRITCLLGENNGLHPNDAYSFISQVVILGRCRQQGRRSEIRGSLNHFKRARGASSIQLSWDTASISPARVNSTSAVPSISLGHPVNTAFSQYHQFQPRKHCGFNIHSTSS